MVERKASSCKITLTITKSKPLHRNSSPSALLMPLFMGSCCESGGEIRLFLERNRRNATTFSDFPFAAGGIDNCRAKNCNSKVKKQQGKMETVKDITKSSHMESSGKMGGEEREKKGI